MNANAISAALTEAKGFQPEKGGSKGGDSTLFALLLDKLQGSGFTGREMMEKGQEGRGDFLSWTQEVEEKLSSLPAGEGEKLEEFLQEYGLPWLFETLQLLQGLHQEGKLEDALNHKNKSDSSAGGFFLPGKASAEEAKIGHASGQVPGENKDLMHLFTDLFTEFNSLVKENPGIKTALQGEGDTAGAVKENASFQLLEKINTAAGNQEGAEPLWDRLEGGSLNEEDKSFLKLLHGIKEDEISRLFSGEREGEIKDSLEKLQGLLSSGKGASAAEKPSFLKQENISLLERMQGIFPGYLSGENSVTNPSNSGADNSLAFAHAAGENSASREGLFIPGAEGESSSSGEEKARGLASFLSKVENFFQVLFTGGSIQGETPSGEGFQGGGQRLSIPETMSSHFFSGENTKDSAGKNLSAEAAPRGVESFGQFLWGQASSAPSQEAMPNSQYSMQEIISQVVERISYLKRSGNEELKVKLHPDSLGEVHIRLRRSKGNLSAEIIAQNKNVKELLENNMDALRQRFQQMDLNIDEFTISLSDEEKGGSSLKDQDRDKEEAMFNIKGPASAEQKVTEEYIPPNLPLNESRIDYLV